MSQEHEEQEERKARAIESRSTCYAEQSGVSIDRSITNLIDRICYISTPWWFALTQTEIYQGVSCLESPLVRENKTCNSYLFFKDSQQERNSDIEYSLRSRKGSLMTSEIEVYRVTTSISRTLGKSLIQLLSKKKRRVSTVSFKILGRAGRLPDLFIAFVTALVEHECLRLSGIRSKRQIVFDDAIIS